MIKAMAKKLLPNVVWSFLRTKKINHMVNSFEKEIIDAKYGGYQLKVSIEDPLAKGWYGNPWERPPEIELLSKSKLKKGAKVIDFGAHQSLVAMLIAKEVEEDGKVLAIEANKHNYDVSCRNKELNDLTQLEIIHCAVGVENGEIEFSDDLNGAVKNDGTTTQSTVVKAWTVNHIIENHFVPDVIFMDIEGYEFHALKSAVKAFDCKADWFIEVHGPELIGRFGGTVADVMEYFTSRNYELMIGNKKVDYHPYTPDSPLLNDHFYMVAYCKD